MRFVASLSGLTTFALAVLSLAGGPATMRGDTRVADSAGCMACHQGIEEMHPAAELSCVDCHGGDGTAATKSEAHVRPRTNRPGDERVAPEREDLAWRRFSNPMDLRVAERTCGTCHEREVAALRVSLHGTTAGHLSDGYYEMGLTDERESEYSVFNASRAPQSGGSSQRLVQVPAFQSRLPAGELATHYTDLARKECMQCHLWSRGRAVRGRVGFDGDYRGEGCAACHVTYSVDGYSVSRDASAVRSEPGHARTHSMTRAPRTETCTSCHYGDASIGLHFRGLSQLPPGAPGGPDIPGTTAAPLNRAFYLNDPSVVPPDVHHERGMHCIDCHTALDVMGDGRMHGKMEEAVEISCADCHGTFQTPATLQTARGTPLEHLSRAGDEVWLTSKVTGARHRVPQAAHVVDPARPDYNGHASLAMTEAHAQLECYTCHAGWNANFLGFHFARNESLTQLDLLSGRKTPGRVTTQEKVFVTWKSFYAGLNELGRIAPYLTGFSTMGTVHDKQGELILDQVMPETAAGLSGMTMIHHQLHSTRPTARSCVECHRSSATWGMGSPNFRLGRQLAFVSDRRGIEVVALNRAQLSSSLPLVKFVLPDVVDMELACDPLQGHAQWLYVSEGGRGVHVLDVSDVTVPRRAAFVATVQPRDLALVGDHLLVADGRAGLRIFDVSTPAAPREVGSLPTVDAHALSVHWPWVHVADGAGGLVIADISAPIAPRVLASLDVNGASRLANDTTHVTTLFQYSRPRAEGGAPIDERSEARHLCALLDQGVGLVLVDVTEPTRPLLLYPPDGESRGGRRPEYRGLSLASHVDLAEAQGGDRTLERDYAYVLEERGRGDRRRSFLRVVDVTEPGAPNFGEPQAAGNATEMVVRSVFYNPPQLLPVAFVPGVEGVYLTDLSNSRALRQVGTLPGLGQAYAVAVEEFPLDQMLDAAGRPLKDVSHPGSRWMYRTEIERVLRVSGEELGTVDATRPVPAGPADTARLFLADLDVDVSGFLEGDEYDAGGGAAMDLDGDGRIALGELALRNRGGAAMTPSEQAPEPASLRVDVDGDLARLLDGKNPYDFDKDGDHRIDAAELEDVFFAALDLDGDERLSRDELSRSPGVTRELRFGGPRARELWASFDTNGDGSLGRREYRVAEVDAAALDADRDGYVQLPVEVTRSMRRFGLVGRRSEWPTRRFASSGLPPVITVEEVLAAFDRDTDGLLSARELRQRPDLFLELDRNDDSRVDAEELARVVGLIDRFGVELSPDAFDARWDLDGDGEVSDAELPRSAVLRLRLPRVGGGPKSSAR